MIHCLLCVYLCASCACLQAYIDIQCCTEVITIFAGASLLWKLPMSLALCDLTWKFMIAGILQHRHSNHFIKDRMFQCVDLLQLKKNHRLKCPAFNEVTALFMLACNTILMWVN